MREERIFLTLDELTTISGQSSVFALSNFVQGLVQVPYDMELIVKDGRLRCFLVYGFLEWFPHVHHSKPNMLGFRGSEPFVEKIHALFRAVFTAEPDRQPFLQIAYHDPVDMAFTDGNFVDADYLWSWLSGTKKFLLHILYFKIFDRFTVKMKLFRNILNR